MHHSSFTCPPFYSFARAAKKGLLGILSREWHRIVTCTHAHTRTHAHTHTHTRMHAHTHTHTRTHTRMYTHTHVHTHARAHAHTQHHSDASRCCCYYCLFHCYCCFGHPSTCYCCFGHPSTCCYCCFGHPSTCCYCCFGHPSTSIYYLNNRQCHEMGLLMKLIAHTQVHNSDVKTQLNPSPQSCKNVGTPRGHWPWERAPQDLQDVSGRTGQPHQAERSKLTVTASISTSTTYCKLPQLTVNFYCKLPQLTANFHSIL